MNSQTYRIPVVDEYGNIVGFEDRWMTHTVHETGSGLVLGQRHVGICVACQDRSGKILMQQRNHTIFDKFWSLSADTHPRKYNRAETLTEAATRCVQEDFGITVTQWKDVLDFGYSARDPRNPKYCENEFLHLFTGKYDGPVNPNKHNVYDHMWAEPQKISEQLVKDSTKDPIDQVYAPWVHAIFEELKKRKMSL
jgi:isopentenyl-diphosphate delta-isomerase